MKKQILLISILAFVVFFSGCIKTKTIREANICGDGICGATEDCNVCPKDCGCPSNQYCSEAGICRTELCGNEICSSEENNTQSCCEDCGCPVNRICNKLTEACQERPSISERDIRNITNNYLIQNNINGTILNIRDAYYKEEIVKQVSIDCRTENIPYSCQIIVYIDNTGKIVEETRTA